MAFTGKQDIAFPKEQIADLTYKIRNGQSNLIPEDIAGVYEDIAIMISAGGGTWTSSCSATKRHLLPTQSWLSGFGLPRMRHWALIPTSLRIGGNSQRVPVLMRKMEAKFWKGCTPKPARGSKNDELEDNQERKEAKFQYREYGQVLPALFLRTGWHDCHAQVWTSA
jgi:hypothetical protein